MADLQSFLSRFRKPRSVGKNYVYFTAKVKDNFVNKIRRIFTSTVVFVTAFVLSNIFVQSLIIVFSKSFKYKLKITYSHITVMPRDIHYWSLPRVVVIYFIPTVLCLTLGLMIFNLLVTNTNTVNRLRLFIFWFALCLVNIFFAHLLFAPFGIGGKSVAYYQAFAIVGSWVGFNPAMMGVFSIGAIFAAIIWGVITSKEVIRFSFSSKFAATMQGKNTMILQVVFLPIILGFLPCIFLCDITYVPSTGFSFLSLILISFGMFVRNTDDWAIVRCNKSDVLNRIPYPEMVVCVILWVSVYSFFR